VAFEPPSVTGNSRPLASRPHRLLVIRCGVLFRPRTTLGLAAKQALLQVPELALGLLQLAAQSRLTRRRLRHRQAMISLPLRQTGKRLLMLTLPVIGLGTELDLRFLAQRHHHLGKRRRLAVACRWSCARDVRSRAHTSKSTQTRLLCPALRHLLSRRLSAAASDYGFTEYLLLFCLLINGLLAAVAHAQTADPVMVAIAYPATSEETIPRASLRAIFGMRLQNWPADTLIRVFVLRDDAPEHATFSKTVLQVFPQQLRMAWDRQVFSGQGRYPEQVAST